VETLRLKPFGLLKPPCAGNTASQVWLIEYAVTLDTSHDAMRKAELYPLRQHPQMQVQTWSVRGIFAECSRGLLDQRTHVSSLNSSQNTALLKQGPLLDLTIAPRRLFDSWCPVAMLPVIATRLRQAKKP
jgi:hypothetical protein